MASVAKLISTICAIILLTYVAFFAVVNDAVVSLIYLPQTAPIEAPLWLVSLICFSAGLVLVGFIASIRISALRLRLYRASKKADSLASQIAKQDDTSQLPAAAQLGTKDHA